jgi:hypothetical protein
MPVQIVSQVYRRRTGVWVPSRTPGISRVNLQQQREFAELCQRLGRPALIQHHVTGTLTQTSP